MTLTRREFLATAAAAADRAAPVVSIARIRNDNVGKAVEEAIDLLGGIERVARGKHSVMLKPNLVSSDPRATTKREVVGALARLMLRAGRGVAIGEGSAAAPKFNVIDGQIFRTRRRDILEPMQQYVFDQLGYTELAKTLRVPLVNLHSGRLADVKVPGGFVFDNITLHSSLTEIDLLCSVPMMKTHQLATVTLGMKNLIGAFPGAVYQSVRGRVHDLNSEIEPTGTSAAIVDMVRANKLGLVVVDGSMAMEGNGPSNGPLVKMDVIIAGANPLATDMVAARVMGFDPGEVPTFTWANKAGMQPASLEAVEIRGERIDRVRRPFVKPQLIAWKNIRAFWGAREI
jgi:uncharacterized protein (DUF362 family)